MPLKHSGVVYGVIWRYCWFRERGSFQKGHGVIWRHMAILLYRITLEPLEGITRVTTEPPSCVKWSYIKIPGVDQRDFITCTKKISRMRRNMFFFFFLFSPNNYFFKNPVASYGAILRFWRLAPRGGGGGADFSRGANGGAQCSPRSWDYGIWGCHMTSVGAAYSLVFLTLRVREWTPGMDDPKGYQKLHHET